LSCTRRALSRLTTGNLDFDSRVPVPFSVFPSAYKNAETPAAKVEKTHIEGQIKLSEEVKGKEHKLSAIVAPKQDIVEEKVHIHVEGDRKHRFRPAKDHSTTHIDIDIPRQHQHIHTPQHSTTQINLHQDNPVKHYQADNHLNSTIDIAERQYRTRYQPNFQDRVYIESTVQPSKVIINDKMGYYDEDGHYHSLRAGLHRAADRVVHGSQSPHVDIDITSTTSSSSSSSRRSGGPGGIPNTVTIPTNHIRIGDIVILQGRPCQVIKISSSQATGQHRFLGVDLFTKQLHEESSFVSSPSPSVVVQTMLGPVFKQYRVLDLTDGHVVAMTETGDVKQSLPVIDQSNLWDRLTAAFESGRGSVRVVVLNDNGRELAVDMKVIHGSRL